MHMWEWAEVQEVLLGEGVPLRVDNGCQEAGSLGPRARGSPGGGLVPPEHTGVAVAGLLDLDGEGALALADPDSGHDGALIDPVYRIAPG
jgi:hypothetical protein